jgi:hypothetical protein
MIFTLPLLASGRALRATLDEGIRSRDPWIQAILLVESIKLVPRPLDEGLRPKKKWQIEAIKVRGLSSFCLAYFSYSKNLNHIAKDANIFHIKWSCSSRPNLLLSNFKLFRTHLPSPQLTYYCRQSLVFDMNKYGRPNHFLTWRDFDI